jgi:enoyl-CoA hydratase/carnithine racemase
MLRVKLLILYIVHQMGMFHTGFGNASHLQQAWKKSARLGKGRDLEKKEKRVVSKDILVAVNDGIATVTLNRPRKRNAVHLAMWRHLEAIFLDMRRQPDLRAVILTGEGGNFCAGADISEFGDVRSDANSGRIYEEATEAATIAIRDCPLPTIAAVSGFGIGGGCGLALACDFRVGDSSTQMGIPAARLGIVYSALDCSLLYRCVGLTYAKRVLFSGRHFRIQECVRIGLIDKHAEDALKGAHELAAEFAGNAPLSVRGSKFILETLDANEAKAKEKQILSLIDEAFESVDYHEGSKAFLEKRPPIFVGR